MNSHKIQSIVLWPVKLIKVTERSWYRYLLRKETLSHKSCCYSSSFPERKCVISLQSRRLSGCESRRLFFLFPSTLTCAVTSAERNLRRCVAAVPHFDGKWSNCRHRSHSLGSLAKVIPSPSDYECVHFIICDLKIPADYRETWHSLQNKFVFSFGIKEIRFLLFLYNVLVQ